MKAASATRNASGGSPGPTSVRPKATAKRQSPVRPKTKTTVTGRRSPSKLPSLVAAFRTGKLLNRLKFYLRQAWFLDDGALEMAGRVATKLVEVARWLPSTESQEPTSRLISTWFERIRGYIDGGLHEVELQDMLVAVEVAAPSARRKQLWAEANGVDGVRLLVWVSLTESERRVLEFGEMVDQGLCPDDLEMAKTNFWTDRTFAPAELAPASGWQDLLCQHWYLAGLPGSCRHLSPRGLANAKKRKSFVVQISREIEKRLIRACRRASRPPKLSDRIRIHGQAGQQIWLDRQVLTIKHPVAFRVLAKLIEAGGQAVTAKEFEQIPGCKGKKIDRIIREHLRPVVGDIIRSKRGNSGGRWLSLPTSSLMGP